MESAVIGNTGVARCNTDTLLQQAGSGLKEWGRGSGRKRMRICSWQNKITVTGWLASPAAVIIVVVRTD